MHLVNTRGRNFIQYSLIDNKYETVLTIYSTISISMNKISQITDKIDHISQGKQVQEEWE